MLDRLAVGTAAAMLAAVALLSACSAGGGGSGSGGAPAVAWDPFTTTVTSGPSVALAFNSTNVGGRDGQGDFHVVWTDGVDVLHGEVADGSLVFTVSALPRVGAIGTVSKPTLAFPDGSTLLVAWTVGTQVSRALFTCLSFDRGQSWDSPLQVVSGKIGTPVSLYAVRRSTGALGAVLAWYDDAVQRVRCSAWHTATWTLPVDLASGGGRSHDVSIGGYGETVFAAWEDNRRGSTSSTYEIYVAKSTDAGLSWSTDRPLPLSGGASPEGQDPSVAIRSDGTIFVGHQQTFEKIVLTRSTDGGQTFDPYLELGSGLFAHTVVFDAAVAVSWESFFGDMLDDTLKTVGLAVSLDNLSTVTTPHALPGSGSVFHATYAAVLLSDRAVDVVWVDVENPSNRKLQWRTGVLP